MALAVGHDGKAPLQRPLEGEALEKARRLGEALAAAMRPWVSAAARRPASP